MAADFGSHRDNSVASCPLCRMMAALKMLFPDDDEPFGYPRTSTGPPEPMDGEPPITLEPEIHPQVFE